MNHRDFLTLALVIVLASMGVGEPLCAQSPDQKVAPSIAELREGMGNAFRTGANGTWIFVIFFLFLIVLTVGLIYFDIYIRQRNKAGIDNPHYLFTELVRAHDLNRVEKHFLSDFADESDLEDPLPLFIEPEYFLAALDDDRFRESHRMIAYLLKKLFNIEHADFQMPKTPQKQTYSGATTIFRPLDGGRGQGTGTRIK